MHARRCVQVSSLDDLYATVGFARVTNDILGSLLAVGGEGADATLTNRIFVSRDEAVLHNGELSFAGRTGQMVKFDGVFTSLSTIEVALQVPFRP